MFILTFAVIGLSVFLYIRGVKYNLLHAEIIERLRKVYGRLVYIFVQLLIFSFFVALFYAGYYITSSIFLFGHTMVILKDLRKWNQKRKELKSNHSSWGWILIRVYLNLCRYRFIRVSVVCLFFIVGTLFLCCFRQNIELSLLE